jgi:DNA-binding transcriptional ArsR family regulator
MSPDRLDTTFSALADPTRRAILARLASGEASVTELAAPFAMSLPAISKHLKVLERAGLIARGREAQWRPCRLEASPLKGVAEWVEPYRRFWEERRPSPVGDGDGRERDPRTPRRAPAVDGLRLTLPRPPRGTPLPKSRGRGM